MHGGQWAFEKVVGSFTLEAAMTIEAGPRAVDEIVLGIVETGPLWPRESRPAERAADAGNWDGSHLRCLVDGEGLDDVRVGEEAPLS